jgi:hypothetical protein
MGLTIVYNLSVDEDDPTSIRDLIGQLRSRAIKLPFTEVTDVIELHDDAADFRNSNPDDPNWWLLIQAGQYLVGESRCQSLPPRHLIAFTTVPGDGCEPANFGLCRRPEGLSGWRWSSFCKTVYANHREYGGVMNFLKCHIAVIKVLDYAREMGLKTEVSDPSGYWDSRNPEDLARAVGGWTPKIASFLARQRGESDETLLARVASYPVLEHLMAA